MKLTETERIILENTDARCKYIARDSGGNLCVYFKKPKKHAFFWLGDDVCLGLDAFNHLFQSVKWENKSPVRFRNKKGEFIL